MKFNKLKKSIFVAGLLVAITTLMPATYLYSFFYNFQEWSNGKQSLFLFSDIHQDTVSPFPQRMDLIKAAKLMNNAFVIAEDAFAPSTIATLDVEVWKKLQKGKILEKSIIPKNIIPFINAVYEDFDEKIPNVTFKTNSHFNPNADYSHLLPIDYLTIANQHISPPICLTQFCHQHGVCTKNIEFRFGLCIEDIIERHEKAIAELRKYHDCNVLDTFYTKILNSKFNTELTKALEAIASNNPYTYKEIFFDDNSYYNNEFDKLFETYLQQASADKKLVIEKDLTKKNPYKIKKESLLSDYDESLIDARILHEIHCNKQYTSIFVCAGGGHIDAINTILPELGFKLVGNVGRSSYEVIKSPGGLIDFIKFFERIAK